VSLFANLPESDIARGMRPLADRMRPASLDEFVGQEHILAPGKPLRLQIERDDPGSIIFWGPPGVGKTTLAKIIAGVTKAEFVEFSAVLSGMKEIKQVMAEAERARQAGIRTILFVDEIHRFNKAQQDAFLPTSRPATFASLARPQRIPALRSFLRCSPAAACIRSIL
jgi:putative ATPase